MTSNSKPTEAGEALTASLSSRGLTQYAAAKFTGTSQAFMNQVITGARLPSSGWLDTVATALEMTPEERVRLHRAAARSHGFKIDLT